MHKAISAYGLGLALLWCGSALADPPATAATATPVADAAKPANPDDAVICRRVEVTGSHAKEKVCHTRKQWAQEDQDDQDGATWVHDKADQNGARNIAH